MFCTFVITGNIQRVGGEELLYGEGDALEQIAGVSAVSAGTLFFGHAVVQNGNEKLTVTLQTNDGELSQCDQNDAVFLTSGEVAIEALADTGRNFADVTVAAAVGAPIHELGIQYDRVYCFDYRNGKIASLDQLAVQRIDLHLGGKDLCAAFAAEEDHAFVKYAQTFYLHGPGAGAVGVQGDPVEVPHVNGVVTPVEGHGFHIDVSIEQLRSAAFDGLGAAEDLLTLGSREEPEIFYAVLIPAGIVDFFRMDANGLAGIPLLGTRTEVGEFRHNEPPNMEQ